jgi:hypothetical protein
MVELEIDSSMKRVEIDDSIFKMAFISDLNDTALDDFHRIADSHKEYYRTNESISVGHSCEGREIVYFDGKIVFEYLILKFNEKYGKIEWIPSQLLKIYALMISVLPGILRLS